MITSRRLTLNQQHADACRRHVEAKRMQLEALADGNAYAAAIAFTDAKEAFEEACDVFGKYQREFGL